MTPRDDLIETARHVMDSQRYLTLGTTGSDGRPRVSPVYFSHADYRDIYWVSSPAAHHSANIAERPDVALVVFDSTAPVGQGRAVYIDAHAAVVDDAELPRHCAEAFSRTAEKGATAFEPHQLRGDAHLRLYHARATSHEVHIPGRDPVHGTGVDTRRPVTL
ncbi:pyridoxamine 5'-phosphate oxidase family protein [Streptomyces sp. NPDC058685]|uniref:pyridoxamine 5'-phosphate oxidase family protein n=1 Tax=Streptomyces sp. NPDC058685 TaxID=3346598 RepID=UPI0036618C13